MEVGLVCRFIAAKDNILHPVSPGRCTMRTPTRCSRRVVSFMTIPGCGAGFRHEQEVSGTPQHAEVLILIYVSLTHQFNV